MRYWKVGYYDTKIDFEGINGFPDFLLRQK